MPQKALKCTAWDPTLGVRFGYIEALLGKVSLDRIIRALSLTEPKSLRGTNTVSYIDIWKILNANVELSGDESHRLLRKAVRKGNFELLIASMLQGETLLAGMRRFAEGARILRPDLQFHVGQRYGHPSLSIQYGGKRLIAREIYVEALAVVIHCIFCWATGSMLSPRAIRGSEAIDGADGSLLQLMQSPLHRRGKGVSIVYDKDAAKLRFTARNFSRWHEGAYLEYVRLANLIESRGIPSTFANANVIQRVRTYLLDGIVDQEQVAQQLGMSVATLRRRLTECGTSYRDLLMEIRRSAAELLLLTDKSADEMAAELGLSDGRCFRRACHNWFGGAPSDVRRQLRRDTPDLDTV